MNIQITENERLKSMEGVFYVKLVVLCFLTHVHRVFCSAVMHPVPPSAVTGLCSP